MQVDVYFVYFFYSGFVCMFNVYVFEWIEIFGWFMFYKEVMGYVYQWDYCKILEYCCDFGFYSVVWV